VTSHWFKTYLLPGLIFQSVVIAGGYATGRELVEFFLSKGPLTGLAGMAVSTLVWGAVLSISFEFARMTKSYNYREFFQHLLGPAWFLFEIAYMFMLLLVLAIIGSAAGDMMQYTFRIPALLGTLFLMGAVGILTFYGTDLVERFMSGWSFLLYGTYVVFLIWGFSLFGKEISEQFRQSSLEQGWFSSGAEYAGYNLAVVPAILFCLAHIQTRREALISGALAALLAIVPGILFYCVMVGMYPEIVEVSVPVNAILSTFDARWFEIGFQIVVFGTFIETGTGLLHALNERIAYSVENKGKSMPNFARPAIAVSALVFAIFVGDTIGLVALIASGYGLLTWAFIAIFVIPVLTIGVWKSFGPKAMSTEC
jgi:uncharacterized membrane protein YkvI